MNKELTENLKEAISNKKAIDFFGKDIVKKLEVQHQDGYPNEFERIYSNLWNMGHTAKYKVPFNKDIYIVTVVDNVLTHPLYINVIDSWEKESDL